MKKQVLMGAFLLAATAAFSQNHALKPKAKGLIDTRQIAMAKFSGPETSAAPVALPELPANQRAAASTTWNPFTASMNIYGSVISYAKPLQYNDELNAVSFVHRKSPTYPTTNTSSDTESGSIVAMISTDCGATWDSTLVFADPVNRGRYPQGGIYNPPGNEDINNAHILAVGPVTHGAGWVGNFYASKELGAGKYDANLSSTANAVQYYSSFGPYPAELGRHDFTAYSFTSTDDGKVRALAGVTDDGLASDTAVMMVTGTYNINGYFDWEGYVFNPPVVKTAAGEEQWISRPMMAWNEAGTVGYVVIMGSRENMTGANVGFQPIVYKTTDGGSSWSLEGNIDFNSNAFKGVRRSLSTVSTDTTLEVPFFNWIEGMDAIVDAQDKLHIFSTVIGTFSNHPDSLAYISSFGTEGYRWPHVPGFYPYLYDFIYDGTAGAPSWSYLLVDSMSTEGPAGDAAGNGYNDNPWDMDPSQNNQKVRIDARLQMSRTPDGEYLVYTWAESDTNLTTGQRKWNTFPNIKARAYTSSSGSVHPTELDITGAAAGAIASRAWFHFTSPKCRPAALDMSNGPVLTVPLTVSSSSPYQQLGTNIHWFSNATMNFGNVSAIQECGKLEDVGIKESSAALAGSFLYPNPAKGSAVLSLSLTKSGYVDVSVSNAIGQKLRQNRYAVNGGGNEVRISTEGLSAGVYFVSIEFDGSSATKKLIVQ